MGKNSSTNKANIQFGTTEYADTVPDAHASLPWADAGLPECTLDMLSSLTPSPGPVYMEGRLVLSLSFQGEAPNLDPIKDDEVVLENYRLWDDATCSWHEYDLAVLRFEHADVVMRLEPTPTALWSGALNTHARVVLVPDLDKAGFLANQSCDLCWKRI